MSKQTILKVTSSATRSNVVIAEYNLGVSTIGYANVIRINADDVFHKAKTNAHGLMSSLLAMEGNPDATYTLPSIFYSQEEWNEMVLQYLSAYIGNNVKWKVKVSWMCRHRFGMTITLTERITFIEIAEVMLRDSAHITAEHLCKLYDMVSTLPKAAGSYLCGREFVAHYRIHPNGKTPTLFLSIA